MYICICNAVTDSDIRNAVDEGVRSMRQLRMATGCSTQCGCCAQEAKKELAQALNRQNSFLDLVHTPSLA